jgi:predicted Zn-dependent protease
VAHATEREVRAALQSEWRFVSAPSLPAYLGRLIRQLKPLLAGDLDRVSVEVFEDPRWWSLALPSGTVLLSVGTLVGVQDEAELVFVLAHELAHAAATDSGERLARVGLHAVLAEENGESTVAWSRAAHDMVRLGYGRQREIAADAQAFRAVAELGYDLQAVGRYLRRLDSMQDAGDSRTTELAVAHPLPSSRLRRLESFVANRPLTRRAPRTNREVFRRAASHAVLDATLQRVDGLTEPQTECATDSAGQPGMGALRLWLLCATLAALAGVAGWYFLSF